MGQATADRGMYQRTAEGDFLLCDTWEYDTLLVWTHSLSLSHCFCSNIPLRNLKITPLSLFYSLAQPRHGYWIQRRHLEDVQTVCGGAPSYLQQHHIDSSVHLGDVTQAIAPLVPLIHFVQMQKRQMKTLYLLNPGTNVFTQVQNSKFLTVGRTRLLFPDFSI